MSPLEIAQFLMPALLALGFGRFSRFSHLALLLFHGALDLDRIGLEIVGAERYGVHDRPLDPPRAWIFDVPDVQIGSAARARTEDITEVDGTDVAAPDLVQIVDALVTHEVLDARGLSPA